MKLVSLILYFKFLYYLLKTNENHLSQTISACFRTYIFIGLYFEVLYQIFIKMLSYISLSRTTVFVYDTIESPVTTASININFKQVMFAWKLMYFYLFLRHFSGKNLQNIISISAFIHMSCHFLMNFFCFRLVLSLVAFLIIHHNSCWILSIFLSDVRKRPYFHFSLFSFTENN